MRSRHTISTLCVCCRQDIRLPAQPVVVGAEAGRADAAEAGRWSAWPYTHTHTHTHMSRSVTRISQAQWIYSLFNTLLALETPRRTPPPGTQLFLRSSSNTHTYPDVCVSCQHGPLRCDFLSPTQLLGLENVAMPVRVVERHFVHLSSLIPLPV